MSKSGGLHWSRSDLMLVLAVLQSKNPGMGVTPHDDAVQYSHDFSDQPISSLGLCFGAFSWPFGLRRLNPSPA